MKHILDILACIVLSLFAGGLIWLSHGAILVISVGFAALFWSIFRILGKFGI